MRMATPIGSLWDAYGCVIAPEIDQQHKVLFDIIAKTRNPLLGTDNSIGLMAELLVHLCEHFYAEEALMRSVGFPDGEQHKTEHDRILRSAFVLAEGHTELTVTAVRRFAISSLLRHFSARDRAISLHISRC